jgi:PAS domain S-box-containing protein
MHGFSSVDEIIGRSAFDLIAENDRARALDNLKKTLEEGTSGSIEYSLTRKDGSTFPGELDATLMKDPDGNAVGFVAITNDITERKEAERRIIASRSRFRDLVELLPLGVWEMDRDLKTTFINKYIIEAIGISEEEIANNNTTLSNRSESFIPEDRERIKENCQRILSGEQLGPTEYTVLRRDGTTFPAMIYSAPIVRQGETAGLRSVVIDITEQKQAQEIFETMSLHSPVGMYIVQDGKFVFVNPQFASDVGANENRILGTKAISRVISEDREEVRQNAIEMLKGKRTTPYEYRITNRAGKTKWFMETVAPIQYQGRRAVLGSVLDVTERKQNEERLRETRRRFRDLVNLLPLSVTEIDAKGNITFANKKAIDESGYTEEELRTTPRNPLDSFIPEDHERVKENIQRILNGENLGHVEYTQQRRDGSTYPVITYSARIVQDGKAAGLRTVTIDVTEQKEAEQEIARKNRELEKVNAQLMEVDRLKSIFLSSMSHELRTPLNAIIGFTSLILDGMTGDINEEQREQLTLVKSSSNHLLSLINDVLDISKIEAGKIELSIEEFALNEVVSEVIDLMTPATQKKGIELISETDGDIQVHTDRRRLKQVLINLAGNAVKFTEQGSVRITAGLYKEKGHIHDDSLEIHVIDTGIGIKREDIDKLFAPFQQVDGSLTRRFEGTGLGLHHSKKILNMLGGNIWVKSRYGKGSDFSFILPLKYRGDEDDEENTGSR